MSDLLNDSPTAAKPRHRILAKLGPNEQILYVADGQIYEPSSRDDFVLYIGAILVTSERLLSVESKLFGRARGRRRALILERTWLPECLLAGR